MRRVRDTGLALLLAGGIALGWESAAPAASPAPSKAVPSGRGAGITADRYRASARVDFVAVLPDGRERRGHYFTAARVRILKIEVEWLTLVGAHTQQLELITPDGSVYQRSNVPVESVDGRAYVVTDLPVAGTWITQHSLEGAWQVRVYLDEAVMPVTTASFTLTK